MCQSFEVLQITDTIIVRTANIYGGLHQTGQLIGDADKLIAATCLEYGYEIVTNNTAHFDRITGLVVQKWLVS